MDIMVNELPAWGHRNGSLFLTREGHALVAGEEEAIEFEMWVNGSLSVRKDLRMRMLTSRHRTSGRSLDLMMERSTCFEKTVDGGGLIHWLSDFFVF